MYAFFRPRRLLRLVAAGPQRYGDLITSLENRVLPSLPRTTFTHPGLVARTPWRIFTLTAMVLVLALMAMAPVAGSVLIREAQKDTPEPLERIPARWIDLPEAPFVARMVKDKAVLVNRTDRAFDVVSTGCVIPQQGRVRVVGKLFSQTISHGAYGPGDTVEGLLAMLNNLAFYVRIEVAEPCPRGVYFAVTGASRQDRHTWDADRTRWPGIRER